VKQLGHTNSASPIQLNTNPVNMRREKAYLQKKKEKKKQVSLISLKQKIVLKLKLSIYSMSACRQCIFTYSLDKLIPCSKRMKIIRHIIGKHLKHAVSKDGCSASNTKYTDTLLKNGINFGPIFFS